MTQRDRFVRLYALPADVLAEVKELLRLNQSPRAVAAYLQQHHGFYPDLDPKTLERQLARFRARVVIHEAATSLLDAIPRDDANAKPSEVGALLAMEAAWASGSWARVAACHRRLEQALEADTPTDAD